MSDPDTETSHGVRYAILADCLDREADSETDEVLRAWRRYEAAVLRDLARKAPKLRTSGAFDQGIYDLAQPHLQAIFREAEESGLDLDRFERLVLETFGAGVNPYLTWFREHFRDAGNERETFSSGVAT